MPRKAKAEKPAMSKTAFVRNQPANMPAKEVSSRAKAAGLVISPGYVYEIRSSTRRKQKGGARAASPASTARRRGRASAQAGHPSDAAFRKMVLELGLGRARMLLEDVERKLRDMIAGL